MPASIVLLLALGAPPAPPQEPPCFAKAKALVAHVETLAIHRRRGVIDLALRRDPSIVCDVVDRSFFSDALVPPKGCTPKACAFPKGLEVAPKLIEDAGFELYVRVQIVATKLREAKMLSEAHERLLSTMLLSGALEKDAH